MLVYNLNEKSQIKRELVVQIEDAVASMYSNLDYEDHFSKAITEARLTKLEMSMSNKDLLKYDTNVSEDAYAAAIKGEPEEFRKSAWIYRKLELRYVLLYNILNSNKKLGFLIRKTLEGVVKTVLNHGDNEVTVSQIIHNIPLSPKTWKDKLGNEHAINAWGIDELRIQLVNELCELDLLDMRVAHKTHVISIPEIYTIKVLKEEWNDMISKALILNRKTILTSPATIDMTGMISQSSWWYRTPELSGDQIEFVNVMHNLKWKFVDNAEELITEAYRQHLKVDKLPNWALARVEEYKHQIRASHENGGHFIAGKFDSALRWYWQAEIGHTQTSEALRALVKPLGMLNPTKYDMSNNVVQMYAVSLKDKGLAKYVSLVDDKECVEDIRLQLANGLNKHLAVDTFNKDNTKPLFMIWAYNAGKERLLDGVYTEEINFFTKELDRTLKTPGIREIAQNGGCKLSDDDIWSVWCAILNTLAPSIVELKRVMKRIVKFNEFTETSWRLPDGAIAQYASVETKSKALHWVSSNLKQRTHTHYRKELEVGAKASGLLPRMIHSIDAYLARQLVIRAAKLGIVVVSNHDSFMFDGKYTETMFKLVRELFIEIMDQNVFYGIIQDFNKLNVSEGGEYVEREELSTQDILVSNPMKLEEM